MSISTPLIYAELLSNIRQISVIAALNSPCDTNTKAELSKDGKQFTLHHDGVVTTLSLPGQVITSTPLQKAAIGSEELSWRLPVVGLVQRHNAEDYDREGPWPAKTMNGDFEFCCRYCGSMIIRQGAIKTWKDLPSDNWAEMMDFWHCHKPSDHEHNSSNGQADSSESVCTEKLVASKGYGANTKFVAQAGVAFVDITTFLLSETDTIGIEQMQLRATKSSSFLETNLTGNEANQIAIANASPAPPETDLASAKQLFPEMTSISDETEPESSRGRFCNTCRQEIGYYDLQAEGVKLWKWALQRCLLDDKLDKDKQNDSKKPSYSFLQPSITVIISSLVSAIISSQACSRLILSSQPLPLSSKPLILDQTTTRPATDSLSSDPICLNFWVLFPSVRYSTTRLSSIPDDRTQRIGVPAMKVFYKQVSADAAKALADEPNVEEVTLPTNAMVEIRKALDESCLVLPESGRKFQGWEVGLLERHEEET